MLQKILHYNPHFVNSNTCRVLIIYDEQKLFIGDSLINFSKLAILRSFFKETLFDINCRNKAHMPVYEALLKNNPAIGRLTNLDYYEIDFIAYDVVICITPFETELLNILNERYYNDTATWKTTVYSLTKVLLARDHAGTPVFPIFSDFLSYVSDNAIQHQLELFISPEEKEWGDQWLRDTGLVKEYDQLYIVLDSASSRSKLMDIEIYFNLIRSLLRTEATKILIYDEGNIGKRTLYAEFLDETYMSKIIFAEKLGLRKDLCLLSSQYVKLVLGPCTGLMHCTSGIFTHFIKNGLPLSEVPRIITYTGKYERDDDKARIWWGNSPLVKCLLLRKKGDKKEAVELLQLDPPEREDISCLLPCSEYTEELIMDHIFSNSVVI